MKSQKSKSEALTKKALQQGFEDVLEIIRGGRSRAWHAVNAALIATY